MRAVLIAAAGLLAAAPAARAGDEARGAEVYESCAACHGDKGVGTDSGPALVGVVGRKAASADGFRYSPAMKRSGITWDAAALDQFIADPQGKVKGNRMPFDGVADAADRDALVAYLQGLK
ncbi:c-type cytochrome [Skermanella rosea]|uniref:c-type cytochrome n=1 Tax=Skermanella rosea TaxID=1817965 RepID=UPI0019348938|nr:c-type cytochrome [Skermanella rosea]UEM03482.1 c-type cytochrome [Skermanella rosea]